MRTMNNPLLAIAYLRVSTEDQHLGPIAQHDAIMTWASRNDTTVVACYIDKISGGKDIEERPALTDAFDALKATGAGTLVVAKRDRIARDLYIAMGIERELAKIGVGIVSADGAGNGNDPASVLMRSIMNAYAEFERQMIRDRTRAALQAKKRKGERVGQIPYGYSLGEGGKLVENDDEQRVIVVARGIGGSLRDRAAELARRGMLSRSGKVFAAAQIARMVRQ